MSTDENKAVVRRFIDEAFVKGNPESVDELISESFVPHTWPSVQPGRESLKQTVVRMASGLSDVAFDVEDIIAEGARVAVRVIARATHRGDFMGMPAAGKGYEIDEIHIFRLENGLIAEHWHVADMLGMMKQMGAMPG
jgi:C-1 hydroxylase